MDIFLDAISIGCEIGAPAPYLSYQSHVTTKESGSQVEFDKVPILQESILEQLTLLVSKDEMTDIQSKFIDQVGEDIDKIKSALSSSDYSSAAEASHRLAGAMLNLGLLRCEAISRALQQAAKNELDSSSTFLKPLEESKEESLESLDQAIERLSA